MLEAVVVATQTVQVGGSRPSTSGEGNAVIAWAAPNDAGFEFDTCGHNRRVPVDLDGFRLVSFRPQEP